VYLISSIKKRKKTNPRTLSFDFLDHAYILIAKYVTQKEKLDSLFYIKRNNFFDLDLNKN